MGILGDWGISLEELGIILSDRPSVHGILIGFLAEYKLAPLFRDPRCLSGGKVKKLCYNQSRQARLAEDTRRATAKVKRNIGETWFLSASLGRPGRKNLGTTVRSRCRTSA